MNIERELGEISAKLESLKEGQQSINAGMVAHMSALLEHQKDDRVSFRSIWDELGSLKIRMAYYTGGLAVIVAILKLVMG